MLLNPRFLKGGVERINVLIIILMNRNDMQSINGKKYTEWMQYSALSCGGWGQESHLRREAQSLTTTPSVLERASAQHRLSQNLQVSRCQWDPQNDGNADKLAFEEYQYSQMLLILHAYRYRLPFSLLSCCPWSFIKV